MAVAPKFDEGLYDQQTPQPPKSSSWKSCLIGCLVVAGVLALLILVVAIWVSYNWRPMFANVMTQAIDQVVADLNIPAEEKESVKPQLNRVVVAFRENQLSMEQWEALINRLQDSPLLTSFAVWVVEEKYFNKSGLSEEEKTEGRQTLRRFVRGMIDGQIPEATVDTVIAPIGKRGPDGQWDLKETVTDEELRMFLTSAKTEADKVNIPDQPADINMSDEIKKIVDETLGPAPGAAVEPCRRWNYHQPRNDQRVVLRLVSGRYNNGPINRATFSAAC